MGESDKATTPETITEPAKASANSAKSRPVRPGVNAKGANTTHFLVPAAGGIKLDVEGERVQSLATDSPLGQALLGLSAGDTAEVKTPRGMLAYEVLSVR
jgi:hypothetical protein